MEKRQDLSIPIAIVVAGALIAGALFFAGRGTGNALPPGGTDSGGIQKDIPKVTADDHVRGDRNAKVVIVEYTDLECPFCKQFDGTMKEIMKEYGADGRVAWVLRHFPLQQLHPNAPRLALASECVAELGGNDSFWAFVDSIFTQAPINTFFDMSKLTATAERVGVNGAAFDACLQGGKHQDKVTKQFNDAIAAGGQGTPFSVAIGKGGKQYPIPGSQPIEQVRATIERALAGN